METTIKKIQKITSKGQITLPVSWRKKIKTNQILVESCGEHLNISPFSLEDFEMNKEYTVFDAIRDNKGKGLKAKNLLSLLKRIEK